MALPDQTGSPAHRSAEQLRHGLGGPGPVTPQEAAERATEAVRLLGLATTGGYGGPAEVYSVVVELALLVRGLPSVLGRTTAWLEAEHDAGRLACDDGQKPTLVVHGALLGLHDATRNARPLLDAPNTATRYAGHLTERARPRPR